MKLRMLGIKSAVQALLGAFVVLCADSALSQAPFYQGKTITLIVGFRVDPQGGRAQDPQGPGVYRRIPQAHRRR